MQITQEIPISFFLLRQTNVIYWTHWIIFHLPFLLRKSEKSMLFAFLYFFQFWSYLFVHLSSLRNFCVVISLLYNLVQCIASFFFSRVICIWFLSVNLRIKYAMFSSTPWITIKVTSILLEGNVCTIIPLF